MQENEIFDFLKGVFSGFDYFTDIQYQQAIQQVLQNPLIAPNRKKYIISQINAEYEWRKNQIKNSKDSTDFSKFLYKLITSPQANSQDDNQ